MTDPLAALTDSAGNERTEKQVEALARKTLDYMSHSEIIEMLVEACGSAVGLPDDLVKCPEHGLWYDACGDYLDD